MKPLYDNVLIRLPETQTKTNSGIYIPESAAGKPQTGTVVAVGDGRILNNGTLMPLEVKVGDEIIFLKFAGSEIIENKEKYLMISERDILAIL
jgi:chaperonin GroES